MSALFFTIPLAMVIALVGLVIFLVAMRKGQFDDIEAPKYRMFFDEEDYNKKK